MSNAITDYPPVLPDTVEVVFPVRSATNPNAAPYRVSVTLASLSLSQFANVATNATGVQVIQSMQIADATTNPSNGGNLQLCATAMAKDFYLWQQSKLDLGFAGLVDWAIDGTSDSVEWLHNTIARTRIQRGVWHTFVPTPLASKGGDTINVTDGAITYNVGTIQFPLGTITQPEPGVGQYTPTVNGGDIHTYRASTYRYTSPVTVTARQDGNKIPCGQIYLYPFIVPVIQTFKRLEVFLTAPGFTGAKMQLAVYPAVSVTNDTPATKIISTTDIAIDALPGGVAGLVGQNVSFTLSPGLYFLAANTNSSNSSQAAWRSATEMLHVLGLDSTTAPYFCWVDGTNKGSNDGTPYGTWPAGAAMVTLHKDTGQETATIYATVN